MSYLRQSIIVMRDAVARYGDYVEALESGDARRAVRAECRADHGTRQLVHAWRRAGYEGATADEAHGLVTASYWERRTKGTLQRRRARH